MKLWQLQLAMIIFVYISRYITVSVCVNIIVHILTITLLNCADSRIPDQICTKFFFLAHLTDCVCTYKCATVFVYTRMIVLHISVFARIARI